MSRLAVALALAVVPLAAAGVPRGRVTAQPSTPAPTTGAQATPPPAATGMVTASPPKPGVSFFGLPTCAVGGRIGLARTRVEVGETFTTTLDVAIDCPDGLRARSAVIVLGGFDAEATPFLRRALADLVAGLADSGGSRVAIVSAGALAVPPRFVDLATERPAVDAAIEGLTERGAPDAQAWADQVRTAGDALLRLEPQQRPLLILVDGLQPTGDATPAVRSLAAVLDALPDVLGLTLIVDVSPSAWLRAVGQGRTASGSVLSTVYVRPASTDGLPELFGSVIDAIGAPIDVWDIAFLLPPAFAVSRTRLRVEPDPQWDTTFPWRGHVHAHRLVVHGTVVGRVVEAGAENVFFAIVGARRRSAVAAQSVGLRSAIFCAHAVGAPAGCFETPTAPVQTPHMPFTPTPTPHPGPPPVLTPGTGPSPGTSVSPGTVRPSPPTTTPTRTASPTVERRRLFMPFANRVRPSSEGREMSHDAGALRAAGAALRAPRVCTVSH